ncbi:MAG: DUF86 domain-containing protein [Planctomycetes bacterium]|nr:DUF86 domain-containing protein [Planctomycetota bacterium]
MSKHEDRVSLTDMLSHASEAVELMRGIDREGLARDRVKQLALTRLMEILGEAANRVSSAAQCRHPDVPWPQVIAMRNRLVHGYDVIDYDLLWDTITNDLPPLIAVLQRIVDEARRM